MEVQRVQTLSSLSKVLDTIPTEYIQPGNQLPSSSAIHEVLDMLVIDFSDPDEKKLVGLVSEASKDWGIFYLVNHGIPNEVISKLQEVGKQFFELPQEEKEVIARSEGSKSIEGYGTGTFKRGKHGWADYLFHKLWPQAAIDYQFWPKNPPAYREANEEYVKRLHVVVDKLFEYLSVGLDLEPNELKNGAGGDDLIYLMKINYFPPCPRPDLALGMEAHTDTPAITILIPNDVLGHQVHKDGHWYDVKYTPNALIVHIGDQVKIMSNGKYKSVYHRTVVNKEKTRMSWPVFLEPPPEHEVGPNPKLVNEDNPPKFKTKKFKDYAYCKYNDLPQ